MSFPRTLVGTVGYIIFVAIIIAMVLPGLTGSNNELSSDTTAFTDSINSTVNSSSTGITAYYDLTVNIITLGFGFIQLIMSYISAYISIFSSIPTPFYIFFLLIFSTFVICIIRLILGGSD